jgi:hypothetical protein
LQIVLNIKFRKPKADGTATDMERAIQVQIEKLFMEVAMSPGYYARQIEQLGLKISQIGLPQNWPDHENTNITPDEFIVWMTKCRVSPTMIDDAHEYARAFVYHSDPAPPGWMGEELAALVPLADGFDPLLSNDPNGPLVITRSPFMPWQHTPDNVVQYDLSYWVMEDTAGLRRLKDSRIARYHP